MSIVNKKKLILNENKNQFAKIKLYTFRIFHREFDSNQISYYSSLNAVNNFLTSSSSL